MNNKGPYLLDSHCHMDFQEFDADRTSTLERCFDLGMKAMVVPGVSTKQWERLRLLCEKAFKRSPKLYFACGIHPWWSENPPAIDSLTFEQHLNHPLCVAIGECGLDFYKPIDKTKQLQVFEQQIKLSVDTGMPLVIHSVKAHNEIDAILARYTPTAGGVIHGFSGSLQQAQNYWERGFYLGVGGTITYERAQKTRKAVAEMPLESLLLETDSPAMPLQGHQGERNSPERIIDIAHCLAELRQESVETITRQTCINAETLFHLEHGNG